MHELTDAGGSLRRGSTEVLVFAHRGVAVVLANGPLRQVLKIYLIIVSIKTIIFLLAKIVHPNVAGLSVKVKRLGWFLHVAQCYLYAQPRSNPR